MLKRGWVPGTLRSEGSVSGSLEKRLLCCTWPRLEGHYDQGWEDILENGGVRQLMGRGTPASFGGRERRRRNGREGAVQFHGACLLTAAEEGRQGGALWHWQCSWEGRWAALRGPAFPTRRAQTSSVEPPRGSAGSALRSPERYLGAGGGGASGVSCGWG